MGVNIFFDYGSHTIYRHRIFYSNCIQEASMSNYLLLRDNQQSGPYSLEKLAELGLRSSDLVWVQGESTGWVYAVDIEELAELVEMVLSMVEKVLQQGKRSGELTFSETARTKSLLIMTNLAAGVQLSRITGKKDYMAICKSIIDQVMK